MDTKRALTILIVLLTVIISVLVGWYFFLGNYTTSQFTKDGGLINCGSENGSHNWKMRECILDALKTCTPAYAKTHSDGVEWEASGHDKSVTVQKNNLGECGVQYIANGQSFLGPYSHNSFCKSVSMSGPASGGGLLLMNDCKGIEGSQTF